MIRKLHLSSIPLALAFISLAFASFIPRAVLAGEETPDSTDRCRACHENLYYLYDSGKWCCFCEQERPCASCHQGNPEAVNKDEAHVRIIASPLAESTPVCQDCHPEDSAEHIQQFSQAAGIEPATAAATPAAAASPAPTTTPHAAAFAGTAGGGPPSPWLELQPVPEWQIAAFTLLGVAFLATIHFGYRCWKADCLPNPINSLEKL